MQLTLQAKEIYGTVKLYPSCEKSALLARLAGTKTLTDDALCLIQQMGYEIQVLPPKSTFEYTLGVN